jgi:hypothetical protein
MRKYRSKKIWLDENHKWYCYVRLYREKIDMQNDYKKRSPNDTNHYKTLGVHNGYVLLKYAKNGGLKYINETGTVHLCIKHCGAGIVSHEFMHAVLWAYKHNRNKEQYPILIKNMVEEEKILHMLTYSVQQFYRWYWQIVKLMK